MIDWVTALLPCLHDPLNSGELFKLDADGCVEWSTPCALSVTGSWDSAIQIKSSGGDGQGRATHLRISGNPSKFLQGHNVFGSDDLRLLILDTYVQILSSLDIHPELSDLHEVETGQYTLSRVDINYSFELPVRSDVLQWIRAAEFTSKTRHGRPSSKGGTLYWGKSSKRWSLKAYSKGEEIAAPKHRLPDSLRDTPITPWADNKLRIELTLRSKELIDIQLNMAQSWDAIRVKNLFDAYVRKLDMSKQFSLSDEQLRSLPQRLKPTYLLWQSGHDPRSTLPKSTYYRHRKELLDFGINIDILKTSDTTNVVPLLRVLEARPASIPDWAYDLDLIHTSARSAA